MDTTFEQAKAEWVKVAGIAAETKREHDRAFAAAFLASVEKTEAGRKADADLKSASARAMAEGAAIAERAAHHTLVHLRGPEVIVDRRVA